MSTSERAASRSGSAFGLVVVVLLLSLVSYVATYFLLVEQDWPILPGYIVSSGARHNVERPAPRYSDHATANDRLIMIFRPIQFLDTKWRRDYWEAPPDDPTLPPLVPPTKP